MYLVFVIYHIMNVKKMRVCIYTEYNFLKITIRSRDNSLWGCLWNNIVWHYRLYRCSLKQHIGLFSRDTPKFDPYSLGSGVRCHFLHGQHASGINLWNKTVPHVYVIAKTTLSLEGHPKSWHPLPHKFQVFQVFKAIDWWSAM